MSRRTKLEIGLVMVLLTIIGRYAPWTEPLTVWGWLGVNLFWLKDG